MSFGISRRKFEDIKLNEISWSQITTSANNKTLGYFPLFYPHNDHPNRCEVKAVNRPYVCRRKWPERPTPHSLTLPQRSQKAASLDVSQ